MEKALSYSSSVDFSSHEPFMCVGYSGLNQDLGYKSIFDSVTNKSSRKKRNVILIKDMAHWLMAQEEYQNLFQLIYDPIMLMIRNPLLSTESRIRKVVQSIAITPRISTQRYILNVFACGFGYKDWAQMRKNKKIKKLCSIKKDLKLTDLDKAYYYPDKMLQEKLLDFFAIKLGFVDWNDFVSSSLNSRNYNLVEEALKFDSHRFAFNSSGWKELNELVVYLKNNNHRFFIIDGTELRLDPETMMKKIADNFKITFTDEMIRWARSPTKISAEQKRPQDLIWYDTLMESTEIKPPLEILPKLVDFPLGVRENLKKVDLPIYFKLFREANRMKGKTGLDQKKYLIKISGNLNSKLTDIGIKIDQKRKEAHVTIRDIDPIFSILYNPSLLKNNKFLLRENYYKEEIFLVKNMAFSCQKERETQDNLILSRHINFN